MVRIAALALLGFLPGAAIAQQGPQRPDWRSQTYLHTTDAVAICLRRTPEWQAFCHGLMQGYADYAVVEGKICLPFGTTREQLLEIFTSPEVVVTTGYIDDRPAIETAVQMFIKAFPCE
ncbi:hypothetical protein [Sinisalibacter aestuarii]|uniref:Rap1a immunity protein domain-containing protein n=1 Tax=Sinisalibacter aestuarii TaxID=2949426 RepID=A0ABQ5LX63_9RHOB|nr:hypothetical protein [Sinisalibacter aestuarii]GKY89565.1 hypothetical protein STA1M1_34340 [Sinisalibacter aestuarii]